MDYDKLIRLIPASSNVRNDALGMQKNIETVKKKSKEYSSSSSSPYQQNFEEIVSKLENKKLSKNYDPIEVFKIAKSFKKQLQEA